MKSASRVSKITFSRLFNLGNYEHVRYEITVDVAPDESAALVLSGLERIVKALRPEQGIPTLQNLRDKEKQIASLEAMTDEVFKDSQSWRYSSGNLTRQEAIEEEKAQYALSADVAQQAQERRKKAMALFDNLGGAAIWKDSKLDWETDDEEF